jgi:solute:Na+ symporter, SSS family
MLSMLDIVVVAIFGVAVVGVGLIKGRREGTSGEEYFLAGHSLSWWLIGISLIAANISSEQLGGDEWQCCRKLRTGRSQL